MLLKHVNNVPTTCFQARKVNVSVFRDDYFVKINPFLSVVCLLNFSILKIYKSRFLVK